MWTVYYEGDDIMKELKFRIRNLKESCVDHIWGDPEDIFIRASDGKAFYFDGFANSLLEYDDPKNIYIEQYTGVKDIKGKEIYEGDIVKCSGYYIGDSFIKSNQGEVRFDDGGFYIVYDYSPDLDSVGVINCNIEIIDNINEVMNSGI